MCKETKGENNRRYVDKARESVPQATACGDEAETRGANWDKEDNKPQEGKKKEKNHVYEVSKCQSWFNTDEEQVGGGKRSGAMCHKYECDWGLLLGSLKVKVHIHFSHWLFK